MTDYIGCIMMQDGITVQSSIQKKVLQVFTDSSPSIFLAERYADYTLLLDKFG